MTKTDGTEPERAVVLRRTAPRPSSSIHSRWELSLAFGRFIGMGEVVATFGLTGMMATDAVRAVSPGPGARAA